MSYSVDISGPAQKDIDGIFKYIAFRIQASETATAQVERIENAIMNLSELPERNRLVPDEPWKSSGMRRLVVDNYLIFYYLEEASQSVYITRVLYSGSDVLKHYLK